MKVVVLFLGSTGAGPLYSYEMSVALSRQGVEVLPILSAGVYNLDMWKSFYGDNACLFETYKPSITHLLLSFFKIRAFDRICKTIDAFNPDVIYCPFGLMWSPILFRKLKGKYHIVSTVHDVLLHPEKGLFKRMLLGFYSLLQKDYGRLSDDLIILNTKYEEAAKRIYRKPQLCVIPHASFGGFIDTQNEFTKVKKCFGFFGRIEYYKGLDLLLETYKQLCIPDVKLLIAGKGEIPQEVLDYIHSEPNIELINRWIEDDELYSLFERTDFTLLPYRTATQSGIIPLSFSFARAVVATNVGALSEQIPDGCGIVVNPSSLELANAIEDLYSNPEQLISMGNKAKRYANLYLTWESSAKIFINYLNKNT